MKQFAKAIFTPTATPGDSNWSLRVGLTNRAWTEFPMKSESSARLHARTINRNLRANFACLTQ
jgi:hypothetical protein